MVVARVLCYLEVERGKAFLSALSLAGTRESPRDTQDDIMAHS